MPPFPPPLLLYVCDCLRLRGRPRLPILPPGNTEPLECRFSQVRSRETNCGNLIADLIREKMNAEVTLLNSGTLRADRVIGPGSFCMQDLFALLPLDDPVVLLGVSFPLVSLCTCKA